MRREGRRIEGGDGEEEEGRESGEVGRWHRLVPDGTLALNDTRFGSRGWQK